MQKDINDKGKDLEFLAGKIQQSQEETAQAVFAQTGPAMQKIITELIQAKQIKVLLAKNETMLFSDPSLDLTDDVTSMFCLLYTSPSPRDMRRSRMPSSA